MKSRHRLAVAFVYLLMASTAAYAQGVGASGTISGNVYDPSSASVPKARVTAVETARGTSYSTTTDSSGQYRFTGLPPATYDVTVKLTGFESQTQKGVLVHIGENVSLDFHLKLASAGTVVEVTAAPPVVDTQRASQANVLTETYIENLPIDRRDYLTFTLLLPGVADSTRMANDQDFRVKQTPQSGLSFYGSNGRGNSVTVDGGEVQDDAGGVRPTVSQDGVQEYQVNRTNYAADLGGAQGASINIVSKSGTNQVHGSVFGYFRNDAMDARDPFAYSPALKPGDPFSLTAAGDPIKNSLSRYQWGGSLGFPVKKDKTFLFFSFENLRQDTENSVPLLVQSSSLGPTFDQQQALTSLAGMGAAPVTCLSGPVGTAVAAELMIPTTLPAATCAQVLGGVLTLNPANGPLPAYLLNQFETQGGLFPYTTRDYLFSSRLDHRIDASNQIFVSYRFAHDVEESPDVQSLTAFSAGSSIHNYDDNLLAAWYHEFNTMVQNEFRFQFDYDSFNVLPNVPGQVGLQIPGYINNLGTNIFLPSKTILRRYEFADNVTWIAGHHTIKFGVDETLRGNHTESHTYFPGRFVFGTLPDGGTLLSPFIASISSLQSSSFGLPQVYQQGFGNPDYPAYTRPLTGLYAQDSWRISPNFTLNYGLRYDIDSQFEPLNTYYKAFAPRVSFAWDPFKDHKTVVRGGYGIFFGTIDAQIPQVALSLGVLNKNHSTVENNHNSSQVPDQVNNLVNTCGISFLGTPVIPPGAGSNSPCTRFISIYVDPITPTPFFPALATSAQVFQGLFAQGLIQCTTPQPGDQACITPSDVAPFGIIAANSGPLAPLTVTFSNPPDYKPPYSQQASLGVEREILPGLSINVSGIYTHTLRLPVPIDTNLLRATPMTTVALANGTVTSYRNWNSSAATDPAAALPPALVGGAGVAPCAANPFACFVNPLIIQNNQYTSTGAATYVAGMLEIKERANRYVTLLFNYTYSKGIDNATDFNTDFGPQDPTDLTLDRGLSTFDQRHKVVLAGVFNSPWKQAVLSGFQLSPIFSYHSGFPFNLLAGGEVNGNNHTTNERPLGAPRDTGLGPDYINFDLRLSWNHKVGEKATLILTAEAFNLANHTNYASVNNEVGPFFGVESPTFRVHGIKPGAILADGQAATPSTPLAFTSAFPMREIQLGLRLNF